jgi:hypothetical protein
MTTGSRATTCPKCKLINPVGAEYCDCGYQFTTGKVVTRPKAEAKYPLDQATLDRVAFSFRALIGLVGMQAVVAIARAMSLSAVGRARGDREIVSTLFALLLLALGVAAAVQAKRLADALQLGSPMAYAFATFIPGVSIVALLSLSSRATDWCRLRGISVGLFGPKA